MLWVQLLSKNIYEQLSAILFLCLCLDNIVHSKPVTISPNNKAWTTTWLKAIVVTKKMTFITGSEKRSADI